MSNLFPLSYSNKKKNPANIWDEKTIAFIILSLDEARHIFVTKRWKLQEVIGSICPPEYSRLIVLGAWVAQWVRSLDLTTHTSLSPIRHGFAPGFVNYKKGAFDLQPQVIKFTSCLPMVGGFLWVLRLPPQLKLAADIIRCIKNDNDLLNLFSSWIY